MRVYRAMKMAEDGQPTPGASMFSLGVRVRDIHPRVDGTVDPGQEGMSVSAGADALPRAAYTKGEPVFAIDTDRLPQNKLVYRPDPYNPDRHGFIEPAHAMKYEHYQRFLHESSELWTRV